MVVWSWLGEVVVWVCCVRVVGLGFWVCWWCGFVVVVCCWVVGGCLRLCGVRCNLVWCCFILV